MSSTNVPVTQAPPMPADAESSIAGSSAAAPEADPKQAEASAAAGSSVDGFAPDGSPDGDQAPPQLDEVAAAAVDLARAAAEEIAEPDTVGEHLGVTVDDGGLTMHSFRCTARGYRGWRWAVTLAHVPGSDRVTVCDTVLLPGADSIQAPAWVPWSDRLAPGDLGAGDDLPYKADDPLLVPGYTVTDEDDADQQLFWELGLGRERVVGLEGLQAAAERWERGPHGPTSELAVQASAACLSCAYLVPVSGFLRSHFGVCTNEWSPADGTVVTTDFGCGAHSETDLELPAPEPLPAHILDETIIEQVFVDRDEDAQSETDGSAEPAADAAPESAAAVETLEPAEGSESEQVADPVEAEEAAAGAVLELQPEVVAEPVVDSLVEPVPEPEPVAVAEVEPEPLVGEVDGSAEPSSEPDPVAEPVPVVDVVAEAEVEPVAEPEPVADVVAEVEPEPLVGEVDGSAEPVPEPVAEVEAEPELAVVDQVEAVEHEEEGGSAEPLVDVVDAPVETEASVETADEVTDSGAEVRSGDDDAEVIEAVEPPRS